MSSEPPSEDETFATIGSDAPLQQAAPSEAVALTDRYQDLGFIAQGGMGEVRRAWDKQLARVVAIKILHPSLSEHPGLAARFTIEGRLTARLQHPGIVPVHDAGTLPDGRLWFAMKEVHGQTFASVISGIHAASAGGPWQAAGGWSFRRLLAALLRVCETVAYTHSQGIIHRDLKPDNIMVGQFGEVLVMDWGLARLLAEPAVPNTATPTPPPLSGGTRVGQIMGTPAYMPPEQARGEPLTPAADAYALGGVLYTVLSGRPPYHGGRIAIDAVRAGPPRPVDDDHPARLPPELCDLCRAAMARDPRDRPSAAQVAAQLSQWLDGARRQEQADALVVTARQQRGDIATQRAATDAARGAADARLGALPGHAPLSEKLGAWQAEDAAKAQSRQLRLATVRYLQTVRSALHLAPEHPAAHALLADHYRGQLVAAEARKDADAAAEAEALLRAHDRGHHAAWLRGDGRLSLRTDPPGAYVALHRYEEVDRRLQAQPVRDLGHTPLDCPLPRGSYLLVITAPGHAPVRYPVHIDRQEHWHGAPPGSTAPEPIVLPPAGSLGPEDCYVPAGWFTAGSDAGVDPLPTRRRWVDGFVIRRFPVTNAAYLGFLNDLLRRGEEDAALAWAPRDESNGNTRLIYQRTPDGFALGTDALGRAWRLDEPVVRVSWHAAAAFARWEADRSGLPWRLPHSLEWEKAARGVDGRRYPCGNFIDPSMVVILKSVQSAPRWRPVDSAPLDTSPYGVRGCAGNVRSWCADFYETAPRDAARLDPLDEGSGTHRMVKGNAWQGPARFSPCAGRLADLPERRFDSLSFRLARALVPRER